MDLQTMRAQFRDLSALESNFFSDAQLDRALNQGLKEFAAQTEILETTNTQDVVSGTYQYALPADFQRMLVVYHNSIPLVEISQQDLDAQQYDWKAESGTPQWFFIDSGLTQVALYPNPDTSITSGLVVEYQAGPGTLSAVGDVPTTPVDTHIAPVYYACWVAHMRDSEPTTADRYLQLFNKAINEAKKKYGHPSKTIRNVKAPHRGPTTGRILNLGATYPPYYVR